MAHSEEGGAIRILGVVAHPHDFTHISGTCGRHADRGDSVTIVTLTGGGRIHDEALRDELLKPAEQRNAAILDRSEEVYVEGKLSEMRQVCGLFGITDVRVLPFADNPLKETDTLIDALTEIILEVRPHVLIGHPPYGLQSKGQVSLYLHDHQTAGVVMHKAAELASTADRETKATPHQIAAVFYTGVEVANEDLDFIVDVSDQAERRLRAEEMFVSQGHTPEFARKRLEIGAGKWGWQAHAAYGEPFVRASVVAENYLPVSPRELNEAGLSTKDRFERMSVRVTD
jgi:LmbE family N-acetylglucosaminyl deacetylase